MPLQTQNQRHGRVETPVDRNVCIHTIIECQISYLCYVDFSNPSCIRRTISNVSDFNDVFVLARSNPNSPSAVIEDLVPVSGLGFVL